MAQRGIDLHLHTTASDGSLSPTELVDLAALAGLSAMAVTDHDTVDGLAEAESAALRQGIEFIHGIELAVDYPTGRFHMLGYFIDSGNAELNARLTLLKHNRKTRNERIIAKLNELGIQITLDDVLVHATGEVGRPHLAFALLQAGAVHSVAEAFERYLADGAAAHVPKDKISLQEGIDLIHGAGGLAVMAHPTSLRLSDDELAGELPRLQALGLDGIECYYNRHTPDYNRLLEGMARRCGLLVTGGSDFHGDAKPDVRLGEVDGKCPARYELLEQMRARLA